MCKGLAILMLVAGAAHGVEGTARLELVGDLVVVPLTINGVGPYPFVLDLGSPGVVVDREVATFLKLPVKPGVSASRQTTSGKPIGATAAEVTTIEAGRAVARNLTVTVTDLRTFKRRLGCPVAGLFSGREFGGRIHIDLAGGTADFSRGSESLSRTDAGVVPFEPVEGGMPVVNGALDGDHVHPLGIDTTLWATVGAAEGVLREMGVLADSSPRLVAEGPATGQPHAGGVQVRLGSVRAGSAEVREPVCAVLAEGQMPRIGLGFLRGFRLTLDYETRLARFERVEPAEVFRNGPVEGYGLGLWRFNGTYWMVWVAEGSPAARAGLISGGLLTGVDGKDVKGMGRDAVAALLEPHEGTKVTVSVMQGDEVRNVELSPEKLL